MELILDAIGAVYGRCLRNRGGLWQERVARYAKPAFAFLFIGSCGLGVVIFVVFLLLRGDGVEVPVPAIFSLLVGTIALSPIVLFHLYLLMNVAALFADRSNGPTLPRDRNS